MLLPGTEGDLAQETQAVPLDFWVDCGQGSGTQASDGRGLSSVKWGSAPPHRPLELQRRSEMIKVRVDEKKGLREKARAFKKKKPTSASVTTLKPLTMWITTNWKILKETEIPDHLACLKEPLDESERGE